MPISGDYQVKWPTSKFERLASLRSELLREDASCIWACVSYTTHLVHQSIIVGPIQSFKSCWNHLNYAALLNNVDTLSARLSLRWPASSSFRSVGIRLSCPIYFWFSEIKCYISKQVFEWGNVNSTLVVWFAEDKKRADWNLLKATYECEVFVLCSWMGLEAQSIIL